MSTDVDLKSVAALAVEQSSTRSEAVALVLKWMKENPELYRELSDQRDELLATHLVTQAAHAANVRVARGGETTPRVDADTNRAVAASVASRTLRFMEFRAAGKVLGNCVKSELLAHAENERKKGEGHLVVAAFMELVASKCRSSKKTVRQQVNEASLAALHSEAERRVRNRSVAMAGT